MSASLRSTWLSEGANRWRGRNGAKGGACASGCQPDSRAARDPPSRYYGRGARSSLVGFRFFAEARKRGPGRSEGKDLPRLKAAAERRKASALGSSSPMGVAGISKILAVHHEAPSGAPLPSRFEG